MAMIRRLRLPSLAILMISMGIHGENASCVDGVEACEDSDGVALLQFWNEAHATAAVKSQSDDTEGETGEVHDGADWKQGSTVVPTLQASINLALPPRERFKEFYRNHFHRESVALVALWNEVESKFPSSVLEDWWQTLHGQFPVYEEEMAGAVDVFYENGISVLSVKKLFLMTTLYELGSPTVGKACSGLLVQQPDGSIVHGRNLDYLVPFDWTTVDYEMRYHRNGTQVFTSMGPGFGVSTGMRIGGWSFEQNTQDPLNATTNLENAKTGAKPFALTVREVMETTQDYGEALRKLQAIRFIAPQYFILSGTKLNEGAVFAVDANTTRPCPYTTTLTLQSTIGRWFLVQTNVDLWAPPDQGPELMHRRQWAITKMNQLQQGNVTVDFDKVKQIMSTFPLYNPGTIMTWVVNVKKGIQQVIPRRLNTAVQGITGGKV